MLTPGVVASVAISTGNGGRVAAEEYPSDTAMSTMAAFVWVRVAVSAVAGDLASVPLIAKQRGNRQQRRAAKPSQANEVDSAALDLLENPNPYYSGTLFRKQLAVDFLLTGNAYIERGVSSIWRLHPAEVEVILGPGGMPAEFRVRDQGAGKGYRRLLPSQVIHIRDVSWASDSRAAYGASAIRALHDDLTTEQATKRLSRDNARRGRPDMLLSAKEDLGPTGAEQLVEAYEQGRERGSAAVAMGGEVTATPLNWTARDLEYSEQSERTKEATLALFEVPPARAGGNASNYGTQKQQMRTYAESLVRRSQFFSDAFTKLAESGTIIVHDFSDVEALQVSYTERLMRVSTWVGLGASPLEAARHEGFSNPPVGDTVEDFHSPRRPKREPDEPEKAMVSTEGGSIARAAPEHAVASTLALYLEAAASRWETAAEAVRGGADLELLTANEAGHLFGVLCGLGVPPQAARWHADDEAAEAAMIVEALAPVAADGEALGLATLAGFSAERAARIAQHLTREMEAAA